MGTLEFEASTNWDPNFRYTRSISTRENVVNNSCQGAFICVIFMIRCHEIEGRILPENLWPRPGGSARRRDRLKFAALCFFRVAATNPQPRMMGKETPPRARGPLSEMYRRLPHLRVQGAPISNPCQPLTPIDFI